MASTPPRRNWRGMIIAFLIILFVSLMIALAIFVLSLSDTGPRVRGVRLSLANLLEDTFKPIKFNATWTSGKSKQIIQLNSNASTWNPCPP